MDAFRGLTLVLAPAFLAALICTAVLHALWGGGINDLRVAFAFALMALLLTVAGSIFLTLMYVRIHSTPIVLRYLALFALGCFAGAMTFFWAPVEIKLIGLFYGGTTACIWCVFHLLVYPADAR